MNVYGLLLASALGIAVTATAMADGSPELLDRGAYLIKVGDCVACHTAQGGRELAGGLPFETPFGTVYSTNITSDSDTGIGHYRYEEFYDAMHHGVGVNGNLYPAMPYTSYSLLTDEDTRAIYAYLMSTRPVRQQNLDNELSFPFNIRMGLKGWNLLFHDPEPFQPRSDKSDRWNRGSYLVNALGHCGECHTPRNSLFAMEEERHFEGAIIEGYEASNITPAELNRQNWTQDDLRQLFTRGYSRKGTVFGGMYPVVRHSYRYLTDEDLLAVSSYLLDTDEAVESASPVINGPDREHPGYPLYMGYCAGCHGEQGQGKPNVAPAMVGNATLDRENPHNAVAVLLRGIDSQYFNVTTGFSAMPGFADALTDGEIRDLVNFLRKTWTNQSSTLDEQVVRELRAELAE